MSYLSSTTQKRLEAVFFPEEIGLDINSDCVVALNSSNRREENIRKIIESCNLCPLMSPNKINGEFVFTVVPYAIPDFFRKHTFNEIQNPQLRPSLQEIPQPASYFTKNRVCELLSRFKYVPGQCTDAVDRWGLLNSSRKIVLPALEQLLSDLIREHANDELPIVEIGSGAGYNFSEDISRKTIRTQPHQHECDLLVKSISDPVFQLDIEALYAHLSKEGKKIPLFFALNVFDTISFDLRGHYLSQISELQNRGDHILIVNDANPLLDEMIQRLEMLHPNHAVLPYFPRDNAGNEHFKLYVILVPLKYVNVGESSVSNFMKLMIAEDRSRNVGIVTEDLKFLEELKNRLNLEVIDFLQFYSEQIKLQLERSGYKVRTYYRASFVAQKPPFDARVIENDIIYKAIMDDTYFRKWQIQDKKFADFLKAKKLSLPNYLDNTYTNKLKSEGKIILGTEVFVIEGEKL